MEAELSKRNTVILKWVTERVIARFAWAVGFSVNMTWNGKTVSRTFQFILFPG